MIMALVLVATAGLVLPALRATGIPALVLPALARAALPAPARAAGLTLPALAPAARAGTALRMLSDPSFNFFEFTATTFKSLVILLGLEFVLWLLVAVSFIIKQRDPDEAAQRQVPAISTSESERLSTFGWLNADLRTPLPTLAALRESCHMVGVRDGFQMLLCTADSDRGVGACAESKDFSAYYGAPVYVCKGNAAARA